MINLSQYLGSQAFDDMCEKFVEQAMFGRTGMYPSAIAAWNAQAHKAIAGINGAQPGDQVFFSPNAGNGYYGHTGIYMGNNQILAATDQGVKQTDLNQWQRYTGQKLLGYVPRGQAGNMQQLGQQITEGPTNPNTPNGMLQQHPLLQQPQPQQPPMSSPDSMATFVNAWNSTHHTPLPGYI